MRLLALAAALFAVLVAASAAVAAPLKPTPTPTGYQYAPSTWTTSGWAQPDDYVGLHINLAGGYQTSGHITVDCGPGFQQTTTWDSANAAEQPRTGTYGAFVYVPRADAVGRVCTVSIVVETVNYLLIDNGEYWLAPRPVKR